MEIGSSGFGADAFLASRYRVESKKSTCSSLDFSALDGYVSGVTAVSSTEYRLYPKSGVSTLSASLLAKKLMASSNNIYDVVYSDDLEDNDLINKPDKPLWGISKGAGFLKLKRIA